MSNIKVLIVDDSKFARDLIKRELLNYGCEVVGEAENGKEAISLYGQLSPDLVTMDISMPIMDGLETTKRIINMNPSALIIIISNEVDKKQFALEKGAISFLSKPFQPAFLWRKIDSIIGKGLLVKEELSRKEDTKVNQPKINIENRKLEENITINKKELMIDREKLKQKELAIINKIETSSKKNIKNSKDKISISPPRGEVYRNIEKSKSKFISYDKKIEEPILNRVEIKQDTRIEKKEKIFGKIKNLFTKIKNRKEDN